MREGKEKEGEREEVESRKFCVVTVRFYFFIYFILFYHLFYCIYFIHFIFIGFIDFIFLW